MRVFTLFTGVLLALAASAADNPFCGKWKLNTEKSSFKGQQEKIQDLGNNKYKFTFGNMSDIITADGTDQPNQFSKGTWSLKQEAPGSWKIVNKNGGKITNVTTIVLSDSDKLETLHSTGTREDGSTNDQTSEWRRVGTGTGFGGIWENTKAGMSAAEWDIEPYESDGLSFITPAYKDTLRMKFDGKDYEETGPRVAPGSTSAGHRIDANRIQITDKIKGKVVDKSDYKVSPDGKTLTITIHNVGEKTPARFVYDRIS